MTVALITSPALEPLSLSEIKAHLRIDHDHEDVLLTDTLQAARAYTEFASGNKLMTQTWRQYEICFPEDHSVVLRVEPFQTISAVTAFDRDGEPTVLPLQDYRILRGDGETSLQIDQRLNPELAHNGLEIDFICGFGDLGMDVPPTLKRAILLLVAHWYEFRGAISPQDQPVSLPPGFDALMAPFRRMRM